MINEIVKIIENSDTLIGDFNAICDTGGRFAGSPSEQLACEYLSSRLEAVTGITPTRAPVNYLGWLRGDAVLERVDGTDGTFPCVSLVRSPVTPPMGLIAELIDVGRGTEQEFSALSDNIAGRIVLVRHEYMFATGTIHRRRKYQWAIEHGAIGFLIANHLPEVGPVTGSSGATPERGIPAIGISAETALNLTQDSSTKIRIRVDAKEMPRETSNLILDLPGQEPEWVVLSAHIDGHHLAESAMDNATGLAAVLSVAAAMAPRMNRFRRGLRIALFTVEEWGLAGSRVYVDGLNVSERQAIKLNLNLDSIAGSPNLTALSSDFPKLETWLLEHADAHGHNLGVHRPIMANSDHFNFARHGIPATRLVAGFNEYQSDIKYVLTPEDTRDKVVIGDLKRATCLTAAKTAEACAADKLELR